MMELPSSGFVCLFVLEDTCPSWGSHGVNAKEGERAVELGGGDTVL